MNQALLNAANLTYFWKLTSSLNYQVGQSSFAIQGNTLMVTQELTDAGQIQFQLA